MKILRAASLGSNLTGSCKKRVYIETFFDARLFCLLRFGLPTQTFSQNFALY